MNTTTEPSKTRPSTRDLIAHVKATAQTLCEHPHDTNAALAYATALADLDNRSALAFLELAAEHFETTSPVRDRMGDAVPPKDPMGGSL